MSKPKKKSPTIIICILLLTALNARCDKTEDRVLLAFETLTYPQSEWATNDFGSKVTKLGRKLLNRYKPNYWIAKDACEPMNFYRQYVPHLKLTKKGKTRRGSRKLLKRYERDNAVDYEFDLKTDCLSDKNPPLYAYAWREYMNTGNDNTVPITILKYAFTFYKSGLPALSGSIQTVLEQLGYLDHWHFLDIHGAVYYLLNSKHKPFALVIAQHNHFRSYVLGKDIDLESARQICFALRSNEPYLCHHNDYDTKYPTAANFKHIKWIISGKGKPFMGGWDIVPKPSNRKKISHRIEYLKSKDPLITSWNNLGPDLKILGVFPSFFRDAPPGMAIYNAASLKPVWKTAQYYYFDPDKDNVFDIHENNATSFIDFDIEVVLAHNAKRFMAAVFKTGLFK